MSPAASAIGRPVFAFAFRSPAASMAGWCWRRATSTSPSSAISRSPVEFTIENDYVTRIGGDGLDAELTRSYYEAWNDREAYATSHVGWGMNPGARWDAMMMYDKGQHNGTELRAFAGNFLFSTGANETAGRFTPCHFDFPMRNCTVELDGKVVVDRGRLCEELR